MANASPIQQLYVAFFQRPADAAGLAYWTSILNSGVSLASIAQSFAGSAEFAATIAGKPQGDIVDGVYQGLFGRAADPAGLQYWRPILTQGGLGSMAGFVLSVLNGAQGLDRQALDNRVLVADQFTTTVNGRATYNSTQDIANARDFLKSVNTFSGTIYTQDQITTFIQTKIADPGDSLYVTPQVPTSGQTYTLTAGADTVKGGGDGDTIVGTVAGSLATGDKIDGGGGTDTLTVTDTGPIDTTGTTVVNVEVASLTSSGTVKANTTGWTGLTSLTLSAVGAVTATAGASTLSITETGAGQTTGAIAADGGSNVTVTSSHNQGGLITIGDNTAPTGTVTVTTSVDAANTGGTIDITGGTVITVTETATNAAGTNVTAESDVTIHGQASTTSVTVTQAPRAAGASAVTGVTGVAGIAAVVASAGTQAVAAVTAVSAVDAVTAVSGVTANGAVLITDSKYNTVTANTITTVALTNYGAGSMISANGLTSLSLGGTAGTLRLNNATNGAGGVANGNSSLALTVNGLSGTNAVTDWNNEITTLNVTTTGANSTLAAFTDTALTTLNVAGDKVLKLSAINGSLTKIAVSGAAGFNDGGTTAANGFAARSGAATFTTTSSGAINLSLNSTTQSFVGSTGVDTIRISALTDATQTITGGSSSTDELILEGGAFALTSATGAKISGFETLGVAANVTTVTPINVTNLGSTFSKLHIIGNSNAVFTNVANNTTVALDVASSSVTVGLADTTGTTDTINVTLGSASSDTVNFGTLVLKDANAVGVGTVNLVSNGVDITAGDSTANTNTIVLTDNGLSKLNFSGTQGLTVTTLNEATTQATAITLNNTNTSSFGLLIGVLTDTNLGNLTFTGTGLTNITTLTDASATSLSISNTGSKLATVGTFTSSAALSNLTLSGNVQIGDGLVGGTGLTSTNATGMTVSGATDNAHVKLSIGAAAAGLTNNVTLGNGNNVVVDATIAGTSNVTVGTGSNFMTIGGATTNTTGTYNITLGTHTSAGPDYITVGTGGIAYATAANYTINGVSVGDRIIFNTDAAATLVGHTAGVITATTAGATVALTITAIEAAVDALAAHGVAYAVFGGNTYIAESISSTLAGTDTTIVKLTGVHTVTATTGSVIVAS